MNTPGFLHRLKELFFAFDGAGAFESSYDEASGPGAKTAPANTGNSADAPPITAGCVQILGLDEIKSRLGVAGARSAGLALVIATETLDKYLGPADVYRATDDNTFQICFETGDLSIARRLTRRISRVIEERLAAELADTGAGISVDTFVAHVPRADIDDAHDTFAALHRSLQRIRDAVDDKKRDESAISALRLATARFQPLWCSTETGETLNRCLLDITTGAASFSELAMREDRDEMIEVLTAMDCVLFTRSVEGLHQAASENTRAKILVPVHFHTLASRQSAFLRLLAALPSHYQSQLYLDIIGVPAEADSAGLLDVVAMAHDFADRVALQISPFDLRLTAAVEDVIWAISKDVFDETLDQASSTMALNYFASSASTRGLVSLAYGANTIGKAAAAVNAGFDYVGGSAVAATVTEPRQLGGFNPLFRVDLPMGARQKAKQAQRHHERFRPTDPNSTIRLDDGREFPCRIPNLSASGAVVICSHTPRLDDIVALGSVQGQVVRLTRRGFALRFLEELSRSTVEAEVSS